MQKALTVAAAVSLLAACAGPVYRAYPPPYETYPPPYERYPAPAASSPGVRHAAVKPLGAGALTAQTVGAYMDRQESELRAKLRFASVVVSRTGNDLTVNLRSDILFGANADTLSPRGSDVIEAVAAVARRYDSTALAVNGFTDTAGTAARNLAVSQSRADTVAHALADDGVDPHRIRASGLGETDLRIPTGAGVNEPRNRRIEIRFVPVMKG